MSTEPVPNQPVPPNASDSVVNNKESKTPNEKSKSKPFLLILGIFVILVILGVSVYALFANSSDSGDIEPTIAPTIEVTVEITPVPTIVSRDLYTVVDCTVYRATTEGEMEIIARENPQYCSRNGFINHENSMVVYNADPETDEEFRLPLLNLKTGDIYNALNINATTFYDDQTSTLYSNTEGVVYKGTLSSQGTSIFETPGEIGGRGISPSDDFGLRLNANGTRLIVQDTADGIVQPTDEDEEGFSIPGAVVISPTGNVLLEIRQGAQTKWVDNNTLLSIVTTNDEGDRVLRRYVFEEEAFSYVDLAVMNSSFGTVYNLDVLGDTVVIGVLRENGTFTNYIGNITEDLTIINDLGLTTTDNYFIDTNTLLGFTMVECNGDFGESNNELTCPVDAPFGAYKTSLTRYHLDTGELEVLMELTDPVLLN